MSGKPVVKAAAAKAAPAVVKSAPAVKAAPAVVKSAPAAKAAVAKAAVAKAAVKEVESVEEVTPIAVIDSVKASKAGAAAKSAAPAAKAAAAAKSAAAPVAKAAKASKKDAAVEEAGETTPIEALPSSAVAEKKERKVVTIESVNEDFSSTIDRLNAVLANLKTSKNAGDSKTVREITATIKRLQKDVSKVSKTKKKRPASDKPTAFQLKVNVSEEFLKFFKLEKGTQLSRVEMQQYIHKYIKDKNLKNPEPKKGQEILPDAPLKKLLKYDTASVTTEKNPEGKLFYYTINKLLENLIIKS